MNNLAKRIIPCLDINNGQVVKGVNFIGLKDMGDPTLMAKKYNDDGADELILLDISASNENRTTILEVVRSVAKEVFVPLTIGGGISNIQNIYDLLNAGADKVSLNSAIIKNPQLITQGATKFGTQCIVAAIDVKKNPSNSKKWEVYIKGGRENTHKDMIEWAKEVYDRGAGEILLTSMDADGTKQGYDLNALSFIKEAVNIPIIASGGAGNKEDILEVFKKNLAEGALAASIFHYNEIQIDKLKKYLKDHKIPVRI